MSCGVARWSEYTQEENNTTITMQKTLLSMIRLIAVGLTSLGLAYATCYVSVDSSTCPGASPPQDPDPTNNCTAIDWAYVYEQYCDSRDGECGRTDCQPTTVQNLKVTTIYPNYLTSCGLIPISPSTANGSGCNVVVLSGDVCGYCP